MAHMNEYTYFITKRFYDITHLIKELDIINKMKRKEQKNIRIGKLFHKGISPKVIQDIVGSTNLFDFYDDETILLDEGENYLDYDNLKSHLHRTMLNSEQFLTRELVEILNTMLYEEKRNIQECFLNLNDLLGGV